MQEARPAFLGAPTTACASSAPPHLGVGPRPVLSVVDKKGRVPGPLGADDGHAMLAAFVYSGAGAEARGRGADVVRATQQRDCWFRCDCLGANHAPILAPVTETHIWRSPHHPDHAEGCPFEMTTAECESYAASLREAEAGDSFHLAQAGGQPGRALVREPVPGRAWGTLGRARTGRAPAGASTAPGASRTT